MKRKQKYNSNVTKWLAISLTTIFAAIFVIAVFLYGYNRVYAGKVYPGVYVAGIPLGGLTYERAEDLLTRAVSKYYANGFNMMAEGKRVNIRPVVYSMDDPDLTYEFIRFDVEKTMEKAYSWGRSGSTVENWIMQWRARVYKKIVPMVVIVDDSYFSDFVHQQFADIEIPVQNATVSFRDNAWKVISEKEGRSIDTEKALQSLMNMVGRLELRTINLTLETVNPLISSRDARDLIPEVEDIASLAPITLTFNDRSWSVSASVFRDWLGIGILKNRTIGATLNSDRVRDYLRSIAKEVDQKSVNAKFEIQDGRVVEFIGSRDGREVDIPATIDVLQKIIIEEREQESGIVVKSKKSEITTADVNDLGITEIIGVGKSDFSGSSANRRKNIEVGAQALNGILIKPGEEFSLVKALGDIDAENGYVQGIVIKGDKTVPEFGGGLCQIGTTAFRAALNSGLPITERRNHSFRVRYYEPAGTDATIYGPHPDFRFVNDTGNYILIQTRLEGSIAIFEFWGTRDGRVATQTEPKIYNFIKPPPTKIIETTELAPGKRKCTEPAVTGATAEFDYRVEYPDGEIKERTFKSYYRPWQEVCLVGVEELSKDETSKIKE